MMASGILLYMKEGPGRILKSIPGLMLYKD